MKLSDILHTNVPLLGDLLLRHQSDGQYQREVFTSQGTWETISTPFFLTELDNDLLHEEYRSVTLQGTKPLDMHLRLTHPDWPTFRAWLIHTYTEAMMQECTDVRKHAAYEEVVTDVANTSDNALYTLVQNAASMAYDYIHEPEIQIYRDFRDLLNNYIDIIHP